MQLPKFKVKYSFLFILVLAGLAGYLARSAVPVYQANKTPPPAIKNLLSLNSDYKVKNQWSINEDGIEFKGWYLDLVDTKQIYWSIGDVVIAGGLVNGDGENLTDYWSKIMLGVPAAGAQKTAPAHKTDSGIAAMKSEFSSYDWETLSAAPHVQIGYEQPNADKAVYVFFEPYCGYCSKLFKQLRPIIDEKKLDVRGIPVAWISPNSAAAIQAMMKGGRTAFWAHEDAKATGKPDLLENPSPETKMAIIQNSELMGTMKVRGTPAMFYKSSNGELLRINSSVGAFLKVADDIKSSH